MADRHEIPSKQLQYAGSYEELRANLSPREIGYCVDRKRCFIKGAHGELIPLGLGPEEDYLLTVAHNGTLLGDGTEVAPLCVNEELFATAEQGATADSALQGVSVNRTELPKSDNKVDITMVDNASYDSGNQCIDFKSGDDVLFTLDARPFVKDGMVDSVVVENGYLKITFNTDAGKQEIDIPLTDIFDPSLYYTKEEADARFDLKADWTSNIYQIPEEPGDSVVIHGRSYPTVTMGGLIWMAENLDYRFLVNGSPIEESTTNVSSTDPRANYYDNDPNTYGVNGNKYGLLYNAPAAEYLEEHKAELLPDGWRVPTQDDWRALIESVGGPSVAGTKLKSLADGGDGSTGFNATLGGNCQLMFYNAHEFGWYWTITPYRTQPYIDSIEFSTNTKTSYTYNFKYFQYSIRLVKDIT